MDTVSYVSDRGLPLLLNRKPARPTITVENYMKWYSYKLVNPDGTVVNVQYPGGFYDDWGCEYDDILNKDGYRDTAFIDHVPNPRFIQKLAEYKGWDIDNRALEMIIGRWERTINNY